MPNSYSAPSNWIDRKFSSKSDKVLILGLFLSKFWFQWSFKWLAKCKLFSLVTKQLLLVTSGYLVVTSCYLIALLQITSSYSSLLLVSCISNNERKMSFIKKNFIQFSYKEKSETFTKLRLVKKRNNQKFKKNNRL